MEENKFKCSQYWPDYIDTIQLYGNENQFVVKLCGEEENESFVERNLNMENIVNMSTDINYSLFNDVCR